MIIETKPGIETDISQKSGVSTDCFILWDSSRKVPIDNDRKLLVDKTTYTVRDICLEHMGKGVFRYWFVFSTKTECDAVKLDAEATKTPTGGSK